MATSDPITESQASYAGGVNTAWPKHYRELREDQIAHGINITVKNGWAESRPALRPVIFDNQAGDGILEKGCYQGGHYYGYSEEARFIFAFGGELVSLDPKRQVLKKIDLAGRRPFSSVEPFVYFEERGGALIARDRHGTSVIIEGDSARFAGATEVPRGLMMLDGWYRLVSVGRDGVSLFFSDHEMDENTTPLSFTDQNYGLANASRIIVPKRIGRIRHLAFVPWLDTDTGVGPLLVFGQYGTMAYNTSVPRDQWAINDISSMVLPTVGACSHRCGVGRSTDYLWRDQDGRIRSYQNARRDESSRHVNTIDRAVRSYYENDPSEYLRYSSAAAIEDRVLFTVNPEKARTKFGILNVRHRSIAVLEGDVSLGYERSEEPVWAGLWTGIRPLDLIEGYSNSRDEEGVRRRMIIPSHDIDGEIRFYEFDRVQKGHDYTIISRRNKAWARKKIESMVVTRPLTFENSLVAKKRSGAALRFSGIKGRTALEVNWLHNISQEEHCWYSYEAGAGECVTTTCMGEDVGIRGPQEQSRMRLVVGGDLSFKGVSDAEGRSLELFYLGQIVYRWTGQGRLEAWAMEAAQTTTSEVGSVDADGPLSSDLSCPINLLGYEAVDASVAPNEKEKPSCNNKNPICEL